MKLLIFCVMVLLLTGCKQAYDSPVHSPDTGYLVIEGAVNSTGSSTLTLSRTTKLEGDRNVVYETGALVTVKGENNSTYFLTEQAPGKYYAFNLNLAIGDKYLLHIHTKDGKDYESNFVAVKNNPPIDSVSWKYSGDGLQLYISTHDPQNNTRYYQWTFDETWQIQSSFYSSLKYQVSGDKYSVVYRFPDHSFDPDIVNCWQYNSSAQLLLGSTAKLTQDIVYLPLQFIPHASIKLGVLYSIDVKQYSWSKEGYEFLEKMKKNTELTGSIFDAQPSELKGNIRCVTDSTEPVIGFFSVCPVQETRIFISVSDVPRWGYTSGCREDEYKNNSDSIRAQAINLMPTSVGKTDPFGGITTFFASEPSCVDCRLRGSNVKPAYWP